MEHNMWDYAEQAGKKKRRAHYGLKVAENGKLSIFSADSNLLMPIVDSLSLESSFATQAMSPKSFFFYFPHPFSLFY